jgi:hypothetical protein
MGWTTYPKPHDPKAELDRGLTWENENGKRRVLASAMTLTNYWAAVEHVKPDGSREVWAATYLIRNNPRAADGYTFGYKDMTEHMGPYGCDGCPEAILKLLTPLPPADPAKEYDGNKSAQEWRDRQWKIIEQRKVAKRVKPGTRVKFANPFHFGRLGDHDTFTKVEYGRRTNVFRLETGGLVRLTGWRERNFEILN